MKPSKKRKASLNTSLNPASLIQADETMNPVWSLKGGAGFKLVSCEWAAWRDAHSSLNLLGAQRVFRGGLLEFIVFLQEGTKSSHYWRRRIQHSVLDVLRPVTLLCLTRTPLFHCCSGGFFFLRFLCSVVWFGLQRVAGKSQWRCRPKQPGLKWLCECSVRDSFRACGKSAHSLLTVATSAKETEVEKGRRQGDDLNRQQIAGSLRD